MYETILDVPLAVEKSFAFVSDFRNAALWDPRTYAAEKVTDGPIAVGTRFVLHGGLMPADLAQRLHIPDSIATMSLPYDVAEFDAPHEFVLVGESPIVRYRDRLEFTPDDGGTQLRYAAELELKGAFAVMEPLLRRMFTRIGDDATRDLAATVARSA